MSKDSYISEYFRRTREREKIIKAAKGIDCPGCKTKEPKRVPTRLIPGKKCKVCGTTYDTAKKETK
jgi:ribosomal protein L37AE/L43A